MNKTQKKKKLYKLSLALILTVAALIFTSQQFNNTIYLSPPGGVATAPQYAILYLILFILLSLIMSVIIVFIIFYLFSDNG